MRFELTRDESKLKWKRLRNWKKCTYGWAGDENEVKVNTNIYVCCGMMILSRCSVYMHNVSVHTRCTDILFNCVCVRKSCVFFSSCFVVSFCLFACVEQWIKWMLWIVDIILRAILLLRWFVLVNFTLSLSHSQIDRDRAHFKFDHIYFPLHPNAMQFNRLICV